MNKMMLISRNALAEIIHGPNVTRSVSEGVVTVRPRLRFGLHRVLNE